MTTQKSPEDVAQNVLIEYQRFLKDYPTTSPEICSYRMQCFIAAAIKAERKNIQHTYKQQNIRMTNNRFVKFCSHEKLKDLIRKGKVVVDHASDDGEYIRFHMPVGAHSVHLGMWTSNFGKEHLVTDVPTVSPKLVEQFLWLFEGQ